MFKLGDMTVLDGGDVQKIKIHTLKMPKPNCEVCGKGSGVENHIGSDAHTVKAMAEFEKSEKRPKLWSR